MKADTPMAVAQEQDRPVRITLPDGSVKQFDGPVSGDALAASIHDMLFADQVEEQEVHHV